MAAIVQQPVARIRVPATVVGLHNKLIVEDCRELAD